VEFVVARYQVGPQAQKRKKPNPKKLSDPGRLAAARLPVQPAASMCG